MLENELRSRKATLVQCLNLQFLKDETCRTNIYFLFKFKIYVHPRQWNFEKRLHLLKCKFSDLLYPKNVRLYRLSRYMNVP